MERNVIAYDLGTGGVKTSIYNANGQELGFAFEAYETYYPQNGWHEQKPEEWWNAVVNSTKRLMEESGTAPETIEALAISGHSLGVIPIGKDGSLLRETTPIWSDTRATAQASRFFEKVSHEKWYYDTGAGFPAHLYSVFKIMWYMEHEREMYDNTDKFIGTKDYINYKMTGRLCTDYSYASGSGVYILEKAAYDDTYITTSGIDGSKLPEMIQSTDIVGELKEEVAKQSPIGSNQLVFNPSLAGGSGLDKSPSIRGGFVGIDLKHTKEDMARACLEGISMNLRLALDALKSVSPVEGEMLIVGGGTKSPLWMQIFADSYHMPIIATNVGQGAGSLGAAAIAAVAVGIWDNFDKIDEIHEVIEKKQPVEENAQQYEKLLPLHKKVSDLLSDLGEYMEG